MPNVLKGDRPLTLKLQRLKRQPAYVARYFGAVVETGATPTRKVSTSKQCSLPIYREGQGGYHWCEGPGWVQERSKP